MSQPQMMLQPKNEKSKLCKIRLHDWSHVCLIAAYGLGGIDSMQSFTVRWCSRCGTFKSFNKTLAILRTEEVDVATWNRMAAAIERKQSNSEGDNDDANQVDEMS